MWLILWAPLFTLMCFPSPSRTTWPGTQPTSLDRQSYWTWTQFAKSASIPTSHKQTYVCAHTHPQHPHNTYKTHHTHTHSHPWHALGCNILPYSVSPFAWFWPWNPVWPYCLEGPIRRNSSDPRNWFFMQLWPGPATTGHVESWDSSRVWTVETLIQSGSSSLNRDSLRPKLGSPHACHWIQNCYHWRVTAERFSYFWWCNLLLTTYSLTVQTTALDTCITLEGKCVGSSDSHKLRHAWAPTQIFHPVKLSTLLGAVLLASRHLHWKLVWPFTSLSIS